MARLKQITNGATTSTGTIILKSGPATFGGYRLNTDGTNAGSLIVRDANVSGDIIVDVSSVSTISEYAPFYIPSGTIYYSIGGTGADCQLYEWLDTASNRS